MADVVRLSVVYDTSQAAANLAKLDTQLAAVHKRATSSTVVFARANDRWATSSEIMAAMAKDAGKASVATGVMTARAFSLERAMGKVNVASTVTVSRLRGIALGGARLAQGLAAGDLSARGLANSIGRIAGPGVAGAAAVGIATLVTALEDFHRVGKDVELTIDSMQNAARDAQRDVARLLGEAPAESPAERAIKRLRDVVRQMRQDAARLHSVFGGGAGRVLAEQADVLEAQIPGVGARAKEGERLARVKFLTDATKDHSKALKDADTIMRLLNAGPLEQMSTNMGILQKRLEFLIKEGQGAGAEAQNLAIQLGVGAAAMRKMERASALLDSGLSTIADAIGDFVFDATDSWETLLNNLLRMLYRDFTGELIGNLVTAAQGTVKTGTVTGGQPTGGTPGTISPSVQTNVNFSVTTPDAAATAQWLERNAPTIATIVANQAGRSRTIRRRLLRA
jgi:hypothetical protein